MNDLKEILFVDDNKDLCDVFKTLVESRCRVNVTTCTSGVQALRHLEYKKYDILVTDIVMPGMDGIELTDFVVKRYGIPVILTTGYTTDFLPNGYSDTDAVCCLSKPYTVTEISDKIKEAFRRRKAKETCKKDDPCSLYNRSGNSNLPELMYG